MRDRECDITFKKIFTMPSVYQHATLSFNQEKDGGLIFETLIFSQNNWLGFKINVVLSQ